MYVSVNNKGEIKKVGVSTDPNLTSLYIADETSPFDGWSEAKICCYKVNVSDGIVTMLTPYVDSRLLDHIDQLGHEIEAVTPYMDSQRAYIGDNRVVFTNVKGKHVTAYCETDSGLTLPTTVSKEGDSLVILFDTLDEVATVTISVL